MRPGPFAGAAARQRGVTLLYVSYHLDEIFKVCDGVTIMRDGRDVSNAASRT
jgi:ABC-type sugar transport system ATPase subunit